LIAANGTRGGSRPAWCAVRAALRRVIQPFSAPAAPDRGNKILWITRDPHPDGPLTITAELDGAVTTREVPGGPGPSLVDLPTPGCWRLALAWPDHTDRVTIAYH
jgi:hypothetical protein